MSQPPSRRLHIAIVGAESTGKTTLARELAAALAAPRRTAAPGGRGAWLPGTRNALVSSRREAPVPRVALVAEVLREWCIAAGRTPRRDEQRGILLEQHRRIDAAAATHDIVVCDTTALMTHVYSDLLFDDRSLLPLAIERQRGMTATLLTALDLPWVADGHQRDGEHVRQPVDDRLRELLLRHGLPFAVVAGTGPARLAQALAALRPLLPAAAADPDSDLDPALDRDAPLPPQVTTRAGLFTRLDPSHEPARPPEGLIPEGAARRDSSDPARPPEGLNPEGVARRDSSASPPRRGWICECCLPEAERALLGRRSGAGAGRLDAAAGRTTDHRR